MSRGEESLPSLPSVRPRPLDLVDDAVGLARRWLAASTASGGTSRETRTVARVAALVSDPAGLDLAVRFVDDVARPHDPHVAARALARLVDDASDSRGFLGPLDRSLLRAGGRLAPALPRVVVPAARMRLRSLVGHLVADAGPGLTAHLARTRAAGYTLNVNLLGEAVLGEDEARARLARTIALVERPDVEYVSVKVSSVASQLVPWDLEGSRDRVVDRLLPLYRAAREHGVFVNLDMEEYRDLALTTAVFRAVLASDGLHDLEAGIALQAYLPDALGVLDDLTAFARERVAAGGAPIKVRFVKGANLAMEAVDAELHGWAAAPYPTKPGSDASFVRLLDHALRPPRTDAVRVGVASHNLFHVALAVLLGRARGVSHAIDVEMLQGMAPAEARAVRDEIAGDRATTGPHAGRGGQMVLYTPVVRDEDFDVAISYLVRRLEENAEPHNFLHALLADVSAGTPMDRQERAFRDSVRDGERDAPTDLTPRRRARGAPGAPAGETRPVPDQPVAPDQPVPARDADRFANAPDTDPALAASRAWAARVTGPDSGYVPVRAPEPASTAAVDDIVARAAQATSAWSGVPAATRAHALRRVARRLEEARTDLVVAMVHEPGKTVAEADPEVSEAVDFARYYADRADELDPAAGTVPGAHFTPDGVTVVTPPWNFPVAIPAGGILAALAAGSAVLAKPAPQTPRCLEVVVAAVHAGLRDAVSDDPGTYRAAGLDADSVADVVQHVRVPDDERGRALVTHRDVARVVLTGSIETARLFARWRPERPVLAETSGKNALVITPSADVDLAVADLVRSAFGHAGQKCSAASLAILVGSAGDPGTGTGRRVRRQLVDAVRSLAVGPATDLATTTGPLTGPASGKLLDALTTLGAGESWLVRPRCLDAGEDGTGRLWTPGLKQGVRPGSSFHLTEYFGPVLGIMTAATLDEAIALQDAVPFGLTGGIHSLDDDEVARWLDAVHVGNASVNRHITGAIVQRQPFGGWKQSSVGPGAKAGGPNYVAQLGRWSDDAVVPPRDRSPAQWLAWAKADDAHWWRREFSVEHDPAGLRSESNVLRYRPVELLTVRVGADALPVEVERVLHAARTAGVPTIVVPAPGAPGTPGRWTGTDDAQLAADVAAGRVRGRVRVIGSAPGLREAAAERVGEVTVLDHPVVASGRRELLTVLAEQAVSRTRHRYGHVRASVRPTPARRAPGPAREG
ncbi:proline dehydrogenase family protein [Cellulosimicrobium arenosum]|uniref:proline dehydrogenase family protein n=1 Tax=Cellulosimicrobium arenosum TaxID=2708133 RepID=UPI0030CA1B94